MMPSWLANAINPLGPLDIRQVLTDSVYYPACGRNGDPVKFLAKKGYYSFVYADYAVGKGPVLESLTSLMHGFKGYGVIAQRDVNEDELVPNGWVPDLPTQTDGDPRRFAEAMKAPFATWAVLERQEGLDEEHGPKRFSLLYIGGDGVATFQALYPGNKTYPAVIAIIQPGTGFGGNWTDFTDPNKILARSVLDNPYGIPDYLLHDGSGSGEEQPCWPAYGKHVQEFKRRWRRLCLFQRDLTHRQATPRNPYSKEYCEND